MAPNPAVYQRLQVYKQSGFGNTGAATRRLAAINGKLTPVTEVKKYRPAGSLLNSVVTLNKESAQIDIEETALTYNESIYIWDSLLGIATPTGNGTSTPYVRTYDITRDAPASARRLYTVEHGNSARGRDVPDCMVTGLALTFSREGATFTGQMLGNAIVDDQALTAALPELDIIPVTAPQIGLKFASTQAGLAGASLTTEDYIVNWNLNNIASPTWPLNQLVGFGAFVDTVPDFSGTVTRNVDATGMALLSNLRAGSTHFMRIQAQGPVLAGISPTAYNAMEIDIAMKMSEIKFVELDGVFVAQWGFETAYDPTWGKGASIKWTNGLAAT